MPFSSIPFLLGFLPLALAGHALAARGGRGWAKLWLIGVSAAFYAASAPHWLWLLGLSAGGNAALLRWMRRSPARGRMALAGIVLNLALLAWFKLAAPALPLGISFFTFTQIGCLLWASDPAADPVPVIDHLLLALFFPALIAGPILTPRDMLPQIAERTDWRLDAWDLAGGAGFLAIGLAKKTLLADPLAPVVAAGFAHPAAAGLWTAWQAALAWPLQLYFDFSGYTDMAIGLAWLFGFRFPDNFEQPYRARSIIAYWQGWHMSLTRFLMAYVHAPLTLAVLRWRRARGLAVNGVAQRTLGGFTAMIAAPIVATMLLAGVWHGVGAPYLLFGALHAAFLLINHTWRTWRAPALPAPLAVALTFASVLTAAVVFRATTVADAGSLFAAMLGRHGPGTFDDLPLHLPWLGLLYALVLLAPTTRQFMTAAPPARFAWRPSPAMAVCLGGLGALGLLACGGTQAFVYFSF